MKNVSNWSVISFKLFFIDACDHISETSGLTENFGESFLNSYEDLIGVHKSQFGSY